MGIELANCEIFYVKDTYYYNYQTFAQEYQTYQKLKLNKKNQKVKEI